MKAVRFHKTGGSEVLIYEDVVFPLQDVAQAHTLIEDRHVRGKLVLTLE